MDRLQREFELVRNRFGAVTVPEDLKWFIVEQFPMPPGLYNRDHTRLLHIMSPAYPQTPPDNFLVPAGLRTTAAEMPGSGYKEGTEYFGEQWGVFSWHPQHWRSSADILEGDNLLTFIFSVEKRLREGAT